MTDVRQRWTRLTLFMALILVALLIGRTLPLPNLTAALWVLAAAAIASPWRFDWGPTAQLFVSLLAVITAAVVSESWVPEADGLHSVFRGLAFSGYLIAVIRLLIRRPKWGVLGTLSAGLLCFLACGSTPNENSFVPLLTAYLMAGYVALRLSDPHRPPLRSLSARYRRTAVFGVLLMVALAVLGWKGLPPIYDRANAWVTSFERPPRTGFARGSLRLGSLSDLLQSERLVLRILGENPQHLRGQVYRSYDERSFVWQPFAGERKPTYLSLPLADDATEVHYVQTGIRTVFLPLEAAQVEVDPAAVVARSTGVVETTSSCSVETVRFLKGPRRRLSVCDPDPELDLAVPDHFRSGVEPLLTEWLGPEETRRQLGVGKTLRLLQARLSTDYRYSTRFGRPRDQDPLLAFLFEQRRGHCEYFASALTLLARCCDIPARLAAGYHVSELNPVGGFWVVRERDAHAWTEAYVPGRGWTVYDPTPLPETDGWRSSGWVLGLWDALGNSIGRAGPWLGGVLLALILGGILLRRLLTGRRVATPVLSSGFRFERPLESFLLFERALARWGLRRPVACPLEEFAGSLRADPRAEVQAAVAPLLAYADLRYRQNSGDENGGVPETDDSETEAPEEDDSGNDEHADSVDDRLRDWVRSHPS